MPAITINGKPKFPTGTYGEIFIVSDQSAAIPDFNVGVIIGAQRSGEGYNVNDGVTDALLKKPVFHGYSQQHLVQSKFGKGSELDIAFGYAKKHGLTACFMVGISPTTQGLLVLQDSGPDPTINVKTAEYGSIARAYFLEVVTDSPGIKISVTPPTNIAYLSATAASSATSYKTKDPRSLKAGDTVFLAANDILPDPTDTVKVVSVTPNKVNGRIVDYTVVVDGTLNSGTSATAANAAFLFTSDTAFKWTSSKLQTKEDVLAQNDEQNFVIFEDADEGISNIPATLGDPVVVATSATGKTPAPVSNDWTTLLANLPALMNEFAFQNKSELRMFLFLTGDATIHTAIRDFAVSRRTLDKPISAVVGTALGAIDLDNASLASNPTLQAAALNNDDVALCVGGADGYGGYLSLAPAVFGLRIGKPVAHNLTNDTLLFTTPEVIWDEDGLGDLTKLIKFGCLTYDNSPFRGLHIEKGINTYQQIGESWNTQDKKTPLIMQRDLADYYQYTRKRLSNTIGTTELEYTANDVRRGSLPLPGRCSSSA